MKKRFAATAILAIVAMATFATTAQAYPSKASACSGCHTKSTVVHVTATQTANNGTTATYVVTVTGPNSILGWTVLSGSTNVRNAMGGTGTFSVAVGKTYTVWGVSKSGSSMPYSNSISISPVAPVVVPPTPAPTSTPNPTTTPAPVTPPVVTPTVPTATGTAVLRRHMWRRIGTIVRLTNPSTGKRYYGTINRAKTKVTFRTIPEGVYKLVIRYRGRDTKSMGRYSVSAGQVIKYSPPVTDDEDDDDDDDHDDGDDD